MMNPLYTDNIQLKANQSWIYSLAEKVESDKLLYTLNYQPADEGKIIFVELTGNNSSKLVRIELNTDKGLKTGEFKTHTAFSNIYFIVEHIRFFSEQEIEFHLTLFR